MLALSLVVALVHAQPPPPRLGAQLVDAKGGGVVTVTGLTPGSAAEAAGLASGDKVLSFAGTPIASADQLIALVGQQPPGTSIPLVVSRKGKQLTLSVFLRGPKAPTPAAPQPLRLFVAPHALDREAGKRQHGGDLTGEAQSLSRRLQEQLLALGFTVVTQRGQADLVLTPTSHAQPGDALKVVTSVRMETRDQLVDTVEAQATLDLRQSDAELQAVELGLAKTLAQGVAASPRVKSLASNLGRR